MNDVVNIFVVNKLVPIFDLFESNKASYLPYVPFFVTQCCQKCHKVLSLSVPDGSSFSKISLPCLESKLHF